MKRVDRTHYANMDIETDEAWRKNIPPETREFIAWDGEGAQNGDRQEYVLFGCSTGEYVQNPRLTTEQLLAFIISVGKRRPNAYHVGFAFDYDVNMIIRNLPVAKLKLLRDNGNVYYKTYQIKHIPSKWLQITEYDRNSKTRTTVRINDMFGFFQTSFVRALKQYIPTDALMTQLAAIESGKEERTGFTYDMIDHIRDDYWKLEIQLMARLANKLRELLYGVDLHITQWHGPGALANFVYKQHKIKLHKADCGMFVYDAARHAYAGGRFERFLIGRFEKGWGIDINSAYPYGISQLPSLSEGEWVHRTGHPRVLQQFGVYYIQLAGAPITREAGPLFHRDKNANISFPWFTKGWYWAPEASLVHRLPNVEIVEAWEYVGWETHPFEFVKDVYDQRMVMQAHGDGAQMALKLLLNSLYGKMAQRVGWERTNSAPTWHQLEWAGWVTSATRAKLFSVMARIPADQLIAVETDGIYTTADPAVLGITDSRELGKWKVTPFEEMMYVQSGMYSKLESGKWSTKYRGLDAKSLNEASIGAYLSTLRPGEVEWPTLDGPTTRFVGYRAALWREEMGMGPMKTHHCNWEHTTKEMSVNAGKRAHSPRLCDACTSGHNPYERPHQTVVRSASIFDPRSQPHDIPWLGDERPSWRDHQEQLT